MASWPNWATISSLQWGRNFIVAEMGLYSENAVVILKSLQWSRNFIVVEMTPGGTAASGCPPCFNGAATLSLRKSDMVQDIPITLPVLQWGRNFIVAEISAYWVSTEAASSFNGAATLSLRKSGCPDMVYPGLKVASMGPQLYRCGNKGFFSNGQLRR